MRQWVPLVFTIVLATSAGSEAATFSSANIDFLGRGRSCGLVAVPGTLDNIFWNPSGLGGLVSSDPTVFAGFMDYLAGIRGGAVGFASGGKGNWGYGPYVTYLSLGSIPVTTFDSPVGGRDGNFSYNEIAGGLATGAKVLPYLWLGGGLKVVRSSLVETASTVACFDVSGTLRLFGSGGASTSGYACVVGRDIELKAWGEEEGEPPTNLEIGLAVGILEGKALVGGSFSEERRGEREVRVGASGLLSKEFEARIGYRRRFGTGSDSSIDSGWQRGLVTGFSVSLGKFWVDYTYEDASPLDAIHRLAVRAD